MCTCYIRRVHWVVKYTIKNFKVLALFASTFNSFYQLCIFYFVQKKSQMTHQISHFMWVHINAEAENLG